MFFREDQAGVKAGDRISSGVYVQPMVDKNNVLVMKGDCIGDGQYKYRLDELKKVIVPKGCKGAGDRAFFEVEGLEKIEYPDSMEYLGRSAHENNCALKSVKLCDNIFTSKLKEVGDKTFKDCYSLKGIEIPVGVESFGKHVFSGCLNLQHIKCSEKVAECIIDELETKDNHNAKMIIEAYNKDGLKAAEYYIGRYVAFKTIIVRDPIKNISDIKVFGKSIGQKVWQDETQRKDVIQKRKEILSREK